MNSAALEQARAWGHEELLLVQEPESGLTAVVAIHDSSLGPAAGGTRMRPYPSLDAAALDALRLSRAMSYKAALCGVARGGGKAVIVGDPARDKSRALLQAFARLLDRLGGRFVSGPDMGIDARDVAVMARLTRHMCQVPQGATVDTAELTAIGVLESIRAAARELDRPLGSLHVAVQGLGQVGLRLARRLHREGARLSVADVEEARVERAAAELGATPVPAAELLGVECDVLSPNAAGGVFDDESLPRLRCRAVVGAANEQLLEPRHGDALHQLGILYGPDYVVNAGGLLSLLFEQGEVDEEGVLELVMQIGPRVAGIWRQARAEGLPPHQVADRLARGRLAEARARRPR
jgi:leucine dehydrogenase